MAKREEEREREKLSMLCIAVLQTLQKSVPGRQTGNEKTNDRKC